MLARPGEARQKPTPTQRRRKAAIEDPNDAVRRLQRLPPNKACADCTSKLTQCVNLSHGTFVCMACSGVHREFSHKIKGIGHSSFTAEEITKLQHSNAGNEAVNAKYLARYDPRMDRLKAPHNNNDMQLLRAWIKKKYIDKAWCERDAAVANNNGAATKKPSSSSSSSKSSSRRKPKTSSAPVPPVAAATTPAAADPFGFDSIAPSAAANNSSWDAFGAAPAPPPANFQADFGNMNGTSSAPPPAAAPPAAPTMPPFQADFGGMNGTTTTATPTHQPPAPASTPFQANFGNNFSQPTMVSMPPPSMMPPPPPPQGQPQQMQPMPQQQPGQGNFVQTPTGNQQQQQPFQANFNQGMMQPPQQQPVQQSPFQANFDQGQMMQQHQVQQQQQQQQPPASASASGFRTNFDQVSQNGMMSANQQQQPQQSFPSTQQQQPQQSFPSTQQQQPQQSFQANFGETMAHQKQQQQPTQMNVGPAQTQVTMNQQSGGMNFGQFQEQQQKQHQQMGSDQQVGMDTNQQMPPVPQQPASVNVQSNGSAIASQIPENQPQQPHQELQPEAINPNAFQPADDKKDAFSAFDSLSLEPTNSRGGTKTPVREVVEKPKNLQFSKFKEGQQVVYTNSQGSVVAVIQKVHFDDELEPFYTINQNGREKQTDDAHLSLPNETIQNQPNKPSDQSSAKLEETAAMLKDLSESQLLEVQQFIASLQSFTQPAPMLSMGMAQQEQNDDAMNHSQQQMGAMSYQQTGSTPIHNQNVAAQENSMPPPQMASFQQPNRMQGMASNMGGIPTQMNAQQPMMQQQQQPTQMYAQQPTVHQQQPGQMYAQQQPAQVQGMGNTGMPQLTMQQQPMMSNVGSAQAQQQVPNPSMMQSMGAQPYAPSPTMAPTAPPPNNLAPVEKEGNPFDVY